MIRLFHADLFCRGTFVASVGGHNRRGYSDRCRDIFRAMGLAITILCTSNCSDINSHTAPGSIDDPARIFSRLELSYHAVTLSLVPGYDTMTLHATARTPMGAVFALTDSVSSVTYQVADGATALRVTADGRLTAERVSGRVLVIASQTIGSVTLLDTAIVKITGLLDPTPVITSISVQPLPGDSAKVDCSGKYLDTLVARAFDAGRLPVPVAVVPAFRSSDPTVAAISATGVITGRRPGQVTMLADAYVYGHGLRDSLRYTIGDPLVQLIWLKTKQLLSSPSPITYAEPGDVVIGVGGSVSWINASDDSLGIEFDDPTAAMPAQGVTTQLFWYNKVIVLSSLTGCSMQGGGNIAPLQVAQPFKFGDEIFSIPYTCVNVGARAFPRAGIYPYRSSGTGVAGRVIVRLPLIAPNDK